jgi:hypothetical protein
MHIRGLGLQNAGSGDFRAKWGSQWFVPMGVVVLVAVSARMEATCSFNHSKPQPTARDRTFTRGATLYKTREWIYSSYNQRIPKDSPDPSRILSYFFSGDRRRRNETEATLSFLGSYDDV